MKLSCARLSSLSASWRTGDSAAASAALAVPGDIGKCVKLGYGLMKGGVGGVGGGAVGDVQKAEGMLKSG